MAWYSYYHELFTGVATDDEAELVRMMNLHKSRGDDFTFERRGEIIKLLAPHGGKICIYDPRLKEKRTARKIDGVNDIEAMRFMGNVSKAYKSYIEKCGGVVTKVEYPRVSIFRNDDMWESIPVGGLFVIADIDNCYWQAAYRLGVISKPFYERYRNLHNIYKDLKNRALATPTRMVERYYYKGGKAVRDSLGNVAWERDMKEQQCNIYHNIRAWCSNEVAGMVAKLGKENVLFTNVDAVAYRGKESNVKMDKHLGHVKDGGIELTKVVCKKISGGEYVMGNDGVRKWATRDW